MKRIIFLSICFIAALTFQAHAQTDTVPSMDVQIKTAEQIKKANDEKWAQLKLNRVQQKRITLIRHEFEKQRDAVMKDESLSDGERDDQLSEISEKEDEKINSVLTAQQLQIKNSWKENPQIEPLKINRTGVRDSM